MLQFQVQWTVISQNILSLYTAETSFIFIGPLLVEKVLTPFYVYVENRVVDAIFVVI